MSHSLSIPASGPFRTCMDWAGLASRAPSKIFHHQWPHAPVPTTLLVHSWGFPLRITTLGPSSGPGEACFTLEMEAAWDTGEMNPIAQGLSTPGSLPPLF